LHGFLWGEGDGSLACWDADARWLVLLVQANDVRDLRGKVKFPRAEVVYCGDRLGATGYLAANGGHGRAIIGGTATAGYSGTATAGDRGTATAGDRGTATAGDRGTATAGYRGTATAGDSGTATAGDSGTLVIFWWDDSAGRSRVVVGSVGEGGIEPNIPYRVVNGELRRADQKS